MIITFTQTFMIFVAVFISAYLLSLLVDFGSEGRGVKLSPLFAAVLFPFCKLDEYNAVSVCLQAMNYLQLLVFVICSISKVKANLFVQAMIVLTLVAMTVVSILITNGVLIKRFKHKEENKHDR